MFRRKVRETDRFVARTVGGLRVTVLERTTYLEAASAKGAGWIEGTKALRTLDGERVNLIAPGEYELPDGRRLTRVSMSSRSASTEGPTARERGTS